MKEKILEQFSFSEEFKEKLVLLVMYRNQSVKEVAKSYNLPNNLVQEETRKRSDKCQGIRFS